MDEDLSLPAGVVFSLPPSLLFLSMPLVNPCSRPYPSRLPNELCFAQCDISMVLDRIITSILVLNLSGSSLVGLVELSSIVPYPENPLIIFTPKRKETIQMI